MCWCLLIEKDKLSVNHKHKIHLVIKHVFRNCEWTNWCKSVSVFSFTFIFYIFYFINKYDAIFFNVLSSIFNFFALKDINQAECLSWNGMNRIISRFGRSTIPTSGTGTAVMPSAQAWIQNRGNDLARCLPRRWPGL